jgi:hypothetical protein
MARTVRLKAISAHSGCPGAEQGDLGGRQCDVGGRPGVLFHDRPLGLGIADDPSQIGQVAAGPPVDGVIASAARRGGPQGLLDVEDGAEFAATLGQALRGLAGLAPPEQDLQGQPRAEAGEQVQADDEHDDLPHCHRQDLLDEGGAPARCGAGWRR